MKREEDTNIVENLIEHLEAVLQKAKVNDLRHFIEPIETTILRVKNLNQTIKVKCDSTDDFQMACSCNDWGNDILTPNGKWICECGENCSCSKTWTSCVNIPSDKIPPQALLEKKEEQLSEENEKINLEPNKTVSILYHRADKKEDEKNVEINTAHDVNYPSKSIDSDDNNNNFKLKDLTKSKCENCKCSTDDKGKLRKTEECSKSSKQERRKKDFPKFSKEEKFINNAEISTQKILEPRDSREDKKSREEAMKETFQQQINCDKPEKPLKCSEMIPNNLFKTREEIFEENKKQPVEKSTITVKLLEDKISKTEKLCQCSAPIKMIPTEREVSFIGKRIQKSIKKSKEKIIERNFCEAEKITTSCNECSLPSKEMTNSEKIDCQCSQDWMKKLMKNCVTQEKNKCCSEYQTGIISDSRDGNVKRADREININQNAQVEEAHCSSNLFSPATSEEKLCSCGCEYFIEGVPDISTISCNNTSKSPRQKMSTAKNKTFKLPESGCGGKCG